LLSKLVRYNITIGQALKELEIFVVLIFRNLYYLVVSIYLYTHFLHLVLLYSKLTEQIIPLHMLCNITAGGHRIQL